MQVTLQTTTTVLPGHKIDVTAPDLKEGSEVRVLVIPITPASAERMSGLDIIESYKGPPLFGSVEAIDRYINEERNSWDR